MHISLVIDVLTAVFLMHGLRYSETRFRQQLCLASLIYLAFITVRTYIHLAAYFGIFERHPSLATRGLDVRVLDVVRRLGAGQGRCLDCPRLCDLRGCAVV